MVQSTFAEINFYDPPVSIIDYLDTGYSTVKVAVQLPQPCWDLNSNNEICAQH